MKWILLFAAALLPLRCFAEFYKCRLGDGSTIYQSEPCKFFQQAETLDINKNYREGRGLRRSEDVFLDERKRKSNVANTKNHVGNVKAFDCKNLRVSLDQVDKQVRNLNKQPGVNTDSPLHKKRRSLRSSFLKNCYGEQK